MFVNNPIRISDRYHWILSLTTEAEFDATSHLYSPHVDVTLLCYMHFWQYHQQRRAQGAGVMASIIYAHGKLLFGLCIYVCMYVCMYVSLYAYEAYKDTMNATRAHAKG